MKFQAKNAEERDVWIQALNDGINRGKNKVFDEVGFKMRISSFILIRNATQIITVCQFAI